MIKVVGTVVGETKLISRINSIAPGVRKSVTETMLRVTQDLQRYIQKNKLAGQLLKRRTGTLAASIQFKVVSSPDGVTGVVGSRVNESKPLKYAGPLENGFDGTVTVKAHMRTIKQAFGHSIEPKTISVRAHGARRHIKAYKYMASSLAENKTTYLEQIAKAVAEGAK